MAKKKILPDDFAEIVESGDYQAFVEVFDSCEIDAKVGRGKTANAFSISGLTAKFVRFLIENGLNMNSDCGMGYPAIAFQAENKTILKLMLDNGAKLDYVVDLDVGNALFYACRTSNVKAVKNLLELGASITAKSKFPKSYILDDILSNFDIYDMPEKLSIVKMLLEAGAKASRETSTYVENIVDTFEDCRNDFDKELIGKYSKAEKELASLFGVEVPIIKQLPKIGDNISIKSTGWVHQFDELWEKLVPNRGASNSIQGEIIRIVGKVSYEILDNGAENWDKDFTKMLKALVIYFSTENCEAPEIAKEAIASAKKISKESSYEDLSHLTELAVKWVVSNPVLIELNNVEYDR